MPDVYFFAEGGPGAAAEMTAHALAVGPSCVPQLLWVLEHGWPAMRCAALACLVQLAPESFESLALGRLEDESDDVRDAAMHALGHGEGDAGDRALLSRRGRVRDEALTRRRNATPAILRALAHDESLWSVLGSRCDEARAWLARAIAAKDEHVKDAVSGIASEPSEKRAALLRQIVEVEAPGRDLAALALLDWRDPGVTPEGELARGLGLTTELAIDVLLEGEPRRAFDGLSAHLQGPLAAVIWNRLESLLDEVTCDPSVRERTFVGVDPRWRGLACPDGIRAALDWLAAPTTHGAFTPVFLPDDENDPLVPPYPLLVAGFPVSPDARLPPAAGWSPWLTVVDHQYDGLGCAQARWVGFVLQLPDGAREALRDAIDAVSGGYENRLERGAILPIEQVLRAFVPGLPAFEGHEALLVSAPCASFEVLRGLPVIRFRPLVRPWEPPSFESHWPVAEPMESYGPAHDRELLAAAAYLGAGPLRIALLWANSD